MKLVCAILFFSAALAAQTGPDWIWSTQGGGIGYDGSTSVAVDAVGNCYVAGYFSDTASFGDSTWTTIGSDYDLFVGKLDSTGNWLWAVRVGAAGADEANGIALGSDGNIYVCGRFTGTVGFGATTLTSSGTTPNRDVFVARLSPAGIWDWAVRAGGNLSDTAWGICAPDNNSLRVTGEYKGSASFGSTTLGGNSTNVFVASLDLSGNWLWASQGGGSSTDQGFGIAGDAAGNCWVTGRFSSFGFFGSIVLAASGSYEAFCARLDSSGNWLWASGAGGSTSFDCGNGIACDAEGNCYVTGSFGGTASFGSLPSLAATEGRDIFVARLSPLGDWVWAIGTGGGYFDYGYAIAACPTGDCCVTGYYSGTAVFGADTLTANGESDLFACLISTSGVWQWAVNTSSAASIGGLGIAAWNGEFLIAGCYQDDSAILGEDTLPAMGNSDMFIARLGELSPSGIPIAPQNLDISISEGNVLLIWDAVIEDTHGFPITVDHYVVYRTSDPEAAFSSAGISYENQWTGSAAAHSLHFYCVKAVLQD